MKKNIFNRVKRLCQNPLFLFFVIFVVGFLVRLYKLNNPIADWHSWRQADTASVTRIYLDQGIDLLRPRYYDISRIQTGFINVNGYRMVEFPIFNLIHYYLAKLSVGVLSFEAAGRLTTVLVSLVSALLLFLIGEKTIGKYGGLIASSIFLLLPYNVYYSRVVLPDPLAVTFGLLGIFLFLFYLEKERPATLLLSGLAFAFSLLVKPFFAVYLFFPGYLLWQKYGSRNFTDSKKVVKYLLFVFVAFLPFFLWRSWINNYSVGIPHFEWAFNGDHIRFRPAFWHWIFVERIGKLILGVWGLIPFSLGIVLAKGNKQKANIAFLVGVIVYTFIVATANVRHDYYQIPLVPAIALIAAQGIYNSWLKKGAGLRTKIMLVFSLGIMLMVSGQLVFEYYKINRPEIIAAGEAADRLLPKDARVIAPLNGDAAFLYHTKRFGWPIVDNDIKRLIEWGAQYFVSTNYADPDTIAFEKRFEVVEKTDQYIIIDLTKDKQNL